MPLSPAEKQRRYRERLRTLGNAESAVRPLSGNAVEPDDSSSVTETGEPVVTERRTPSMSEDEYVALMMRLPPLLSKDPAITRSDVRERQEAYARWRYRCFVNGEVASL